MVLSKKSSTFAPEFCKCTFRICDMKKGLIIVIVLAVVAAAGAAWYYYSHPQTQPTPPTQPVQDTIITEQTQVVKESQQTQPKPSKDTLMQAQEHQRTVVTNKKIVYEPERVANPLLVGQWQEDGTQHYKIYLDDACDEESYFWGKEWDEAQGILEEDLSYHGNGWFKWSKTHNELIEIYVSEQGNVVVPTRYMINQLNDSVCVCQSFKITEANNKTKRVPFRTFNYHRMKL